MGEIEIRFDERQLRRVRRLLRDVPKGVPRALSGAINKTLRSLRALAVKRISAASGLQQKTVRAATWLKKASRQVLAGRLRFTGKRVPIYQMGARQVRKGVSYTGEGKTRQTIPGAFIATMPSGHVAAFTRLGGKRLPIRELMGPSVAFVWHAHGDIEPEVRGEGNRLLTHYVNQELNWALERYARG